jgi:hypothetical protein
VATRSCRWCWKNKGRVTPAVETVADVPICSECFAALGIEEEHMKPENLAKVRKSMEPGMSTSEVARRAGVSYYVANKCIAAIHDEQKAGAPEMAQPRVDPLRSVTVLREDPAPAKRDRNSVGVGTRPPHADNGEIRVDLLAELRKRREALDQAIRALEIFEQ